MLIRIAGQWHESNSLAATEQAGQKRLHVGFAGSKITAQAVVRTHGPYFEVETVALEGQRRRGRRAMDLCQLAGEHHRQHRPVAQHRLGRLFRRGGDRPGRTHRGQRHARAAGNRLIAAWGSSRARRPSSPAPRRGCFRCCIRSSRSTVCPRRRSAANGQRPRRRRENRG